MLILNNNIHIDYGQRGISEYLSDFDLIRKNIHIEEVKMSSHREYLSIYRQISSL